MSRVAPALTALADLRDQFGTLERLAVAGLRAQGHCWAEIGMALGISRKEAKKRFGRQGQVDGERESDWPEVRQPGSGGSTA